MVGIVLLFFMFAWAIISFIIAIAIFKNRAGRGKPLKVAATAITITLLPFLQELYIVGSFSLECSQHGGIVRLQPVKTSQVEITDGEGWSSIRILEHPAIAAIKTTGNTNTAFAPPTYWLSKAKGGPCNDPIHSKLINPEVIGARVLPRHVAASGFCYSSVSGSTEPDIVLTGSKWRHYSDSVLPPFTIVREQRFAVVRKSTAEPLSELVLLSAEPGSIRKSIYPYYNKYHCPASKVEGDALTSFPFNEHIYQFLREAIVDDAN